MQMECKDQELQEQHLYKSRKVEYYLNGVKHLTIGARWIWMSLYKK